MRNRNALWPAALVAAPLALGAAWMPAHGAEGDTLQRIVPLPEIVVSTSRAGDRTPIARSVLTRAELQRLDWGQDTPMALAALPGAYAYSDAGNGIGYSYLSVRGFPQRRISVLIDGVPLNDPESHEVYWIDHPDLLASTSELQVQRGVGAALYGAASVGGAVNLETSPFSDDRIARASLAYGDYRTRRAMVEMGSGRLPGGWSYYGRYSRIETDGYRDQSWSHLWSYYFGARKLFGRQSLAVSAFGGPEETHLAYKGAPRSVLDGGLTGSAERDRRFNPLTYPYEADHFFEPHYEMVHSWSPRQGLALTQTLFWFDGRGYYDEERKGEALSSYRLDTLYTADGSRLPPGYYLQDGNGNPIVVGGVYRGVLTDLVRRRTVANQHYGWIPRLRITHPDGELIVGGELRFHDGHHWGEVLGGNGLPAGTPSAHRYYDYHPRTFAGGLFLREEWRPVAPLTVTGDLAWRHQSYFLRGDRFDGNRFDQGYDFAVPRLGATWRPRENLSVFGSWSYSEREPRFVDLFKGEQGVGVPYYDRYDPARGIAEGPLVKPEKVSDYELGGTLALRGVTASANLFLMDFRDELVDFQFNANFYDWITTNAARSVHQGVELALATEARPARDVSIALDANGTLGDNHFVDFKEQLDPLTSVSRDGQTIGFFPSVIANASGRLVWKGVLLGAETQHVGEIFLDNGEDPSGRIAPHTMLNLTAGYQRPFGGGAQWALRVRVFNVLDKKYETGGYFDYDTGGNYVAHFVPAATRHAIAQLDVEF
ncbi:MAG TPA: TonB-dependent receptor [Candidatus Eisenbacteria bacterium]|jgi:iron complex outermembrane receptor protein